MSDLNFALPSGYNWEIKEFVKKVKSKSWVKLHNKHLYNYVDRLTSSGHDLESIIKSMLISGYGFNIGEQVFNRLKGDDLLKIKNNLLTTIN